VIASAYDPDTAFLFELSDTLRQSCCWLSPQASIAYREVEYAEATSDDNEEVATTKATATAKYRDPSPFGYAQGQDDGV
jgi:hypothetical protein